MGYEHGIEIGQKWKMYNYDSQPRIIITIGPKNVVAKWLPDGLKKAEDVSTFLPTHRQTTNADDTQAFKEIEITLRVKVPFDVRYITVDRNGLLNGHTKFLPDPHMKVWPTYPDDR